MITGRMSHTRKIFTMRRVGLNRSRQHNSSDLTAQPLFESVLDIRKQFRGIGLEMLLAVVPWRLAAPSERALVRQF